MLDVKIQTPMQFKEELEAVQQQEHEYKLFGKFYRTAGLQLYQLNMANGECELVEGITSSTTIHTFVIDNKLTPVDLGKEKVVIDPRNIFFEALNIRTAMERVVRYRNQSDKLCNLRKHNENSLNINLW